MYCIFHDDHARRLLGGGGCSGSHAGLGVRGSQTLFPSPVGSPEDRFEARFLVVETKPT